MLASIEQLTSWVYRPSGKTNSSADTLVCTESSSCEGRRKIVQTCLRDWKGARITQSLRPHLIIEPACSYSRLCRLVFSNGTFPSTISRY